LQNLEFDKELAKTESRRMRGETIEVIFTAASNIRLGTLRKPANFSRKVFCMWPYFETANREKSHTHRHPGNSSGKKCTHYSYIDLRVYDPVSATRNGNHTSIFIAPNAYLASILMCKINNKYRIKLSTMLTPGL
jgi:hypothetical protein